MSQNEQILKHLQNHEGITSMQAFNEYGITRLSGRIHDLRSMGYDIVSEQKKSKNRYGVMTNYVEYKLKGENG